MLAYRNVGRIKIVHALRRCSRLEGTSCAFLVNNQNKLFREESSSN
jgi:hypothetical protein